MFAAYRHVLVSIMVMEASFYSERLHLPIELPIRVSQVGVFGVGVPQSILGSGGRVDTEHYSFCFPLNRRFIVKWYPFGHLSAAQENEMLSHGTSLIDTNGAYQLASNWLSAIQVDVHELEKTNRAEVRQRWYYATPGIMADNTGTGKTMLPVFEVRWGEWDEPKIEVSIDGRTREMIYIRQEDDSFSLRPEELIKNLDKLLEIPDEEFAKYSPLQRSNLVSQYAVVDYRHPEDVPASISHRYDVTNNYPLFDEKYTPLGDYKRRAKESEAQEK